MNFRRLAAGLVLLLASIGMALHAVAAENDERPALVIVIDSADFYPYYYREDGRLLGPMPEVTRAVLSTMDYSVDFLEVPWARAVDLVTRRQADAITGIFYRRERESFLHYPEHYPTESLLSLMVPVDSKLDFDGNPSALAGYDVGAVLGWTYSLFEEPLRIGRLDFVDEKVLVQNVALGRIDAGIGNPTSLSKYADDLGVTERIRLLHPPVERTPLYTAFSKKPGHDRLAERFSSALAKFKDTPHFQEILHRYGIDQGAGDGGGNKAPPGE